MPLDWATTQNNLGNALETLGERESGTARLEQAVAAYRDALQERTRERVPLDWAMTQNNLGTALRTLGERESGTARLEEAVTAYRDALKEQTRERVPLEWATTQNNLGNALADARGTRERHGAAGTGRHRLPRRAAGTHARARAARLGDDAEQPRHRASDARGTRERHGRLEQAVTAYRDALQERTRERVPLDWARRSTRLSNTLAALAERLHDPARMAEALDCMRNAAAVYRDGGNSYWLPIAEQRIREIEAQLAAMQRKAG